MKGLLKLVAILVLVGVIVGGAAAFMALRFLNEPASTSEETVIFDVKPGESFRQVARRLEQEGLVSNGTYLQYYARFTGAAAKLRVGEYALRRNSTPKDLVSTLASGRSVEYAVTIQEGFNLYEIAQALDRSKYVKGSEFLSLVRDRNFVRELLGEDLPSLEGYLFPETYHITKFTGAKGLIRMMVDRFKVNFEQVQQANGVRLTRHQLVTLASIVEKETGAPEERPVISSVFHNRLRLNMRLQTDPTVVYGIWARTGNWNRNISRQDLLTPSPYNTYTLNGLPYGPIANPGYNALQAAANPANTEFLFFVSRNDGTHVFSKTYEQHNRAVAQFQLDARARAGKSWRDLNKRAEVPERVIEAPVSGKATVKTVKPLPETKRR